MTTTTDCRTLAELWRERQEAYDAPNDDDLELEDDPAWHRYMAADAAIRAARPMTLAGIAIQARVLQDSLKTGRLEDDIDLARVIAEQLEAMAPVKPHAGAVLLSVAAAAQIREALTVALEHHDGDVEERGRAWAA
jgi:hypothetical protein